MNTAREVQQGQSRNPSTWLQKLLNSWQQCLFWENRSKESLGAHSCFRKYAYLTFNIYYLYNLGKFYVTSLCLKVLIYSVKILIPVLYFCQTNLKVKWKKKFICYIMSCSRNLIQCEHSYRSSLQPLNGKQTNEQRTECSHIVYKYKPQQRWIYPAPRRENFFDMAQLSSEEWEICYGIR